MKRSRVAEAQIIGILRVQEAWVSVVDLCRRHGVSDATICTWKANYGGMDISEAKRLKGSGCLIPQGLLARSFFGMEGCPAIGGGLQVIWQRGIVGGIGTSLGTPVQDCDMAEAGIRYWTQEESAW
ncbi:Haem-degrading [Rhodobacter sp. 24-YEA-8]|nr:Haem-degrading [Rhodobacter sp. 24-YEA-8]